MRKNASNLLGRRFNCTHCTITLLAKILLRRDVDFKSSLERTFLAEHGSTREHSQAALGTEAPSLQVRLYKCVISISTWKEKHCT